MRFHSIVQLGGKTATGIPVPAEAVESLGSSKRPLVSVTINGYTYRSVRARGVHAPDQRPHTGAGVAAGDEVDVDIELDIEPREVTVPPDFADTLDRDADAKRFFEGSSYSQKQRHVLSIEEAKTTETRQRRIAKAVSERAAPSAE